MHLTWACGSSDEEKGIPQFTVLPRSLRSAPSRCCQVDSLAAEGWASHCWWGKGVI